MNRQLQSKAISVVNLFSVIQLLKALETRHISECFSSCLVYTQTKTLTVSGKIDNGCFVDAVSN